MPGMAADEVRYEADGAGGRMRILVVVAYGTSSRVVLLCHLPFAPGKDAKLACCVPITLWPFPQQVLAEARGGGKTVFSC